MRYYPTKVQTAPAEEPITLAEAKQQTRVTHDGEDDLLLRAIKGAREHVEQFTRRKLITQTIRMTLDWGFPNVIILPFPPVQSVPQATFTYVDTDGVVTEVPTALYVLDIISDPARLHLDYDQVWPTPRIQRSTVSVDFITGYGDTGDDVPSKIIEALLMMTAHFYEVRQPHVLTIGGVIATYPKSVDDLLLPYVKHY